MSDPIYTEYELSQLKASEPRLTYDAVLDPTTMAFVNPADIAARDRENVERLKELMDKGEK